MHVAFVILDGMPARHVTPSITPTLWELGTTEGVATVGEAVMTSSTYPNHASFITGALPADHKIAANFVKHEGAIMPAHRMGPQVPTMFDRCTAAGLRSIAVLGDQHLVGVMGAEAATYHWPPGGHLPDGIDLDRYGYAADSTIALQLSSALGSGPWDFLVLHLNEPDTAGHLDGPDSAAAASSYHGTDAALARCVALLQPWWDDLVMIIVSDHDQKEIDLSLPPVDLAMRAIPEGSGAVLWDDPDPAWLDDIDGVAGHEEIGPGMQAVWTTTGRTFAIPAAFDPGEMHGHHGGIETRDQVVCVTGGHPEAGSLGASVAGTRPPATMWAGEMALLLGLP